MPPRLSEERGWGNSRAKGVLVSICEGSVKKNKKKVEVAHFSFFFLERVDIRVKETH